jgi:hypothetical protein
VLKYIFIGIWVCGVTLGSAYGVMYWQAQSRYHAADKPKEKVELEQVKTKIISVPIVYEGKVRGYVLAQFTFTIEASMLKDLEIKPDIYFVDEAFRIIYSGDIVNFTTLRKPDIPALAKVIKDSVNKRLGKDLVREVFVQELNYIPQEQFRGGVKK